MFDAQNSKESDFLKKHFREYYLNHTISSVPELELREFGYGVFKRKIANRNLAFSSAIELNSFLREKAPLFFSYSNSCYNYPEKTPTLMKGWLKADLIYEFDADELGLSVEEINGVQWFEKSHLDEAKRQVFRLLDFIENDFNFSLNGVSVNFSGKAGYHIHLRSEEIQKLNKRARIELVDYLTAHNMDFVNLGFDTIALLCPTHNGLWSRRMVDGIKDFFNKDPKEIAKIVSSTQKKVTAFVGIKDRIFDAMSNGKLIPYDTKKNDVFWQRVLEVVSKQLVVPIDRQTSTDLNKIVRVPMTLHGDTGLLAKTVSIDELKNFDPYVDSVVFGKDMVNVHVIKAPKFSLGGEVFGPFEDSTESLPLFCAVYLIGKGAAVLI